MSFLLDIRRTHVYKKRGSTENSRHFMHLFLNVPGDNRDRYEVLCTNSRGQKRSALVTYPELAEMFAHGCFTEFNIRLRMKPHDGVYPSDPPGLRPRDEDIVPSSPFAQAVSQVATRAALSAAVKDVLRQLGVELSAIPA